MERRGFLKGLFGGVVAAGATPGLIVQATDADVVAFTQGRQIGEPVAVGVANGLPAIESMLYDRHGRPVAVIEAIDIQREWPVEITAYGDVNRSFTRGALSSARIQAVSVGPIENLIGAWRGV